MNYKMSSSEEQLQNLIRQFGLTEKDIKLVKRLNSFHDMGSRIIQRLDTGQYMYVEMENSWIDGVDDYFKWFYITENRKNEIIQKNIYKKY